MTTTTCRPFIGILTVLLLLFAGLSGINTAKAQDATVAADLEVWSGALDTGGGTLRLKLEIKHEDDKKTAVLISVDQGNVRIPVDVVAVADGKLTFDLSAINGGYEGTLNEAGDKATGTWSQNGVDLPLTMSKNAAGK